MVKPSERLISLDAFRGFTIVLMIMVNNPGSWSYVLPPLGHASWHGCTPTDLVFPFFLFIMGVAMAYSFSKRLEGVHALKPVYIQIIKRTVLLIVLGWLLSLYPKFNFSTMRIPGVLPRIGVCYFFASLIILHFNRTWQIISALILLFGYWAIMTLIPFPSSGSDHWALGSNFAQHIDSLLLKNHMWKPNFDPEGLISTIPAIAQVLLGFFTGSWLRSNYEKTTRVIGMFVAANAFLVLGMFWSYWMPINKQLWTSSYVLYTVGIALHFLAICFWLIDMKGYRHTTEFFIIFGSNAIFAFWGSSFIARNLSAWKLISVNGLSLDLKSYIYHYLFVPVLGNYGASVLFPILFITFWFFILRWMYNRKIFIKL